VAWDEPHVSVGGLLEAGKRSKRKSMYFLGKKACTKRSNSWKETQHMHMQGRCAQGNRQLEGRKTHAHAEEDLTMVGLGFW
jgi:hypothetical protein